MRSRGGITSHAMVEIFHDFSRFFNSNLGFSSDEYNQLTSLKGIENVPNLEDLYYNNNPIYDYITTHYNDCWTIYIKDLRAVLLIETWFLEVRYSPEYAYCRRKVYNFYDTVVNVSDDIKI